MDASVPQALARTHPPRRDDAHELAGRAALCRSILQQRLCGHPDVVVALMALDGATITEILAYEVAR